MASPQTLAGLHEGAARKLRAAQATLRVLRSLREPGMDEVVAQVERLIKRLDGRAYRLRNKARAQGWVPPQEQPTRRERAAADPAPCPMLQSDADPSRPCPACGATWSISCPKGEPKVKPDG